MNNGNSTTSRDDPSAVFFDRTTNHWLEFRKPLAYFLATEISDVLPSLQHIESIVRENNLYAAGFISYEAAPAFDNSLTVKNNDGDDFPLLWFGLFEKPEIVGLSSEGEIGNNIGPAQWQPTVSRSEYDDCFRRIKELIACGDTYQVNYTHRLRSTFSGDPFSFFRSIVGDNPPPYACYFQSWPWAICSFSPELFFERTGSLLRSRPMKGTHIRGRTAEEDDEFARTLFYSDKNRAENIMIVDMVRNDIGRIAGFGAVQTGELYSIERYPTVLQMTSSISGHTTASFSQILTALFPCASVTGAPKHRTMQIIKMLETTKRRIYTGAIGYLTPKGDASFNVAIRTMLIDQRNGSAEFGTGGGIVWDSDSDDEFRECCTKARILFEPAAGFSLLETLLWTPGNGYFLFDSHMKRLMASGRYFGFKVDCEAVAGYLNTLTTTFPRQPQRVRITVDRNGKIIGKTDPMPTRVNDLITFRRLAIAPGPVHSDNRMLYHKTTSRGVYDNARKAIPGSDDVLLWNERNEITETTIANIVLEINGRLVTPRLFSGLLPGVFREFLLGSHTIFEEAITIDDLKKATKIFAINSIRMWEPCTILQ